MMHPVRLMPARYGSFLLLFWLGACSGSISTVDEAAGTPSPPDATPIGQPALNLHLVMTERAGKHVVDGYFSRATEVAASGEPVWSDSKNTCVRLPDIDPEISASGDAQWLLERSARRIDISTREGHYASLIPQQVGNAIVYAANERWVNEPLPEDAVLQVAGTEDTSPVTLALSPLPPLQRLSSEGGWLAGADNALQWLVVAASDDAIELRLSAVGAGNEDSDSPALITIECMLADDGFFEVPDALFVMLGEPQYVNIGMARIRQRRVDTTQGGYLRIVQISDN